MKRTLFALILSGVAVWASSMEPARVTRYTNAPADAFGLASRTTGMVELALDIDAKGNLKATRFVKGRPDLVHAAVRTVRNWSFEAAKVDGKEKKSTMNVVVGFAFGPAN